MADVLVNLGVFSAGVACGALIAAGTIRTLSRRAVAAQQRATRAERLAEIGAMTSGLAHEIRNPLSTIGLNAQLLTEAIDDLPIDDADRQPIVRRIGTLERESERLRGILADFLDYAGEIHLVKAPCDLNAIVDELIDFFTPQAEHRGIRVRADLLSSPDGLNALVDANHLKQALLNLMLNATQAMAPSDTPPPGRPTLGDLIIRTSETTIDDQPAWAIHVIDTGPGMEPAVAARIFAPYFTTKAGGTGLGLPTAKRLIEEHGGTLSLHSEPGKGTDFTIALPKLTPDQ